MQLGFLEGITSGLQCSSQTGGIFKNIWFKTVQGMSKCKVAADRLPLQMSTVPDATLSGLRAGIHLESIEPAVGNDGPYMSL